MYARYLIFILSFLFCSLKTNAQSFNYSYIDPCTGVKKTIVVPSNGVTVSYYGQVKTFDPNDFYNGAFGQWAQEVYSSYGGNNPCASIVGLPTAINITQGNAMNVIGIMNSLSMLGDLTGSSDMLGGSISSISNGSSEDKKSEDKKENKSKETTQSSDGSQSSNNQQGQQNTGSQNSQAGNTQTSGSTSSSNQSNPGGQQGSTGSQTGSQPAVGNSQGSNNQTTPQGNPQQSGNSQSSSNTQNAPKNTGSNTQGNNGQSSSQTSGNEQGGSSSQSSQSSNNSPGGQSSTGTQGSSNTGQGSSNTGGSGSTGGTGNGSGNNQNGNNSEMTQQNSTATSNTEDKKTNVLGGSTNAVASTSGAKSGTASATSKNGGRPSILMSSDFAGFNFKGNDVSYGGKVTGGYTAMRWDGKVAHGFLCDYTSAIRGPNLSAFYALMHKRRIDLVSTSLTLGFDVKKSIYGTLAIGQMWSFTHKKRLKVVYMLTGSFGNVYEEKFLGTAFIAGTTFDVKLSKRIDLKLMGLYVYAPYVSYYNDLLLKSPNVVLPFVGANIGVTKRFKISLNGGGAWALNENVLNYTVMLGTRFLL